MKIRPIISNNLYKNISPLCFDKSQSQMQFVTAPMASDVVSFSAKNKKAITDLRFIPGITCACCGVETIPNPEIDKFLNKEIYYPAEKALNILKTAGYFNSKKSSLDEMTAYTFCKLCAGLYENETLSEILEKDDIKEMFRSYSFDERQQVLKIEKMAKQLAKDSEYMIKALEPYSTKMGKTESEVFQILKDVSQKHPQKTFSEILSMPKIKEFHLRNLETAQNRVFANVIKQATRMSPESFNIILNTVTNSKKRFDSSENQTPNKRTAVIESFERLYESIPEKKTMQDIIVEINNLPSSRNNASSFIIKYADLNSNVIVDQLLRGSSATHEHVKPRRRENDNGLNNNSNYVVLCKNCNNDRARTPYSVYMKTHPDMPKNFQKYLDKVIQFINTGLLVGFDSYPVDILNAVKTESDGLIRLNYSSLNLLDAKKNRKK